MCLSTADYKEWTLPARFNRAVDKWEPPQEKFGGMSTNQKDFTEPMLSPREFYKRQEEWAAPDGPFVGATDYRDTYKQHDLPERHVRQREIWTQPVTKFNGMTTKQSDFLGAYEPKRESCRPNRAAFSSDAPFEGSTTNKADYKEKPLGQKYKHVYRQYVKPEGKIDLCTTNQTQFQEHPVSRHKIEKPSSSHLLRGKGPMATESGYNADFLGQTVPRRELLRQDRKYEPPTTRFEGQSVAKRDFVEKDLSPRETCRPRWEPVSSEAPFDDSTENRASYVEKPIPTRRRREKEVYVASKVPFQPTTTTNDSYKGQFTPKRRSCKPDQTALQSDVQFDGRTTFMNDFKQYEVKPIRRHEHEKYTKPEGDMNFNTSNSDTFRDFGRTERHVITKPSSSHILRGEGKMADGSSYLQDFPAPPSQLRKLIKPKDEYQPSTDRFEGMSTQKASYTGAYAPKPNNFKPQPRPLQNLNAFEDNTSYRQDYVPWRDAVNQQSVIA